MKKLMAHGAWVKPQQAMNISALSDELFALQHMLAQISREYHTYVVNPAWSDTICERVDKLKASSTKFEKRIEEVRELLRSLSHDVS